MISNYVICATSKGSDQPEHMCSLIRAFANRLNILWLLSYWPSSFWVSKLNRKLHRLVYSCHHTTLLEITCHGSHVAPHKMVSCLQGINGLPCLEVYIESSFNTGADGSFLSGPNSEPLFKQESRLKRSLPVHSTFSLDTFSASVLRSKFSEISLTKEKLLGFLSSFVSHSLLQLCLISHSVQNLDVKSKVWSQLGPSQSVLLCGGFLSNLSDDFESTILSFSLDFDRGSLMVQLFPNHDLELLGPLFLSFLSVLSILFTPMQTSSPIFLYKSVKL